MPCVDASASRRSAISVPGRRVENRGMGGRPRALRRRPDARRTRPPLTADGDYPAGDLGLLDETGFHFYHGRRDDPRGGRLCTLRIQQGGKAVDLAAEFLDQVEAFGVRGIARAR